MNSTVTSKSTEATTNQELKMTVIGSVERKGEDVAVKIAEPYRAGLKQLDHFTHVMVFWWCDRFDSEEERQMLQMEPPYAPGHMTGVFASRSPFRPNPIAMTTCKILGVDEDKGIVKIENIDAFNGTHVVDLKAYFAVCDRVEDSKLPEWLQGWPETFPPQGIGLMDHEQE